MLVHPSRQKHDSSNSIVTYERIQYTSCTVKKDRYMYYALISYGIPYHAYGAISCQV